MNSHKNKAKQRPLQMHHLSMGAILL